MNKPSLTEMMLTIIFACVGAILVFAGVILLAMQEFWAALVIGGFGVWLFLSMLRVADRLNAANREHARDDTNPR